MKKKIARCLTLLYIPTCFVESKVNGIFPGKATKEEVLLFGTNVTSFLED